MASSRDLIGRDRYTLLLMVKSILHRHNLILIKATLLLTFFEGQFDPLPLEKSKYGICNQIQGKGKLRFTKIHLILKFDLSLKEEDKNVSFFYCLKRFGTIVQHIMDKGSRKKNSASPPLPFQWPHFFGGGEIIFYSFPKPLQSGIVQFLICSNRNRLVSDSLPSAMNWFIHYVVQITIVLHLKVNIYIINNHWTRL